MVVRVFLNSRIIQTTKMETILLIEDDKEILENIIEYFELEGYKIYFSNNGGKGIELARKLLPDLIICDVLMRDMDGYEVLRLLLNSRITYEIPFIFSTSMSEKVNRSEALNLGADDYIIKPFELEHLLKIAKTWIKSGSKRHYHITNPLDTE
jgi:CheY-like chemotaxis protein